MASVSALPVPPMPPLPQGGETYRISLPNTVSAPKVARDFVTSLLGVSRHHDLVDDARLCVTEVVTNVHRHTGTPVIRVVATVNSKQVTVSVADDKPWSLPLPGEPCAGREREGGQGLLLVAAIAFAWGATIYGGCLPGHKTVWFTLAGDVTST
jgi:anti-sigma regulatory factor (Ser/Thr protein kinase)